MKGNLYCVNSGVRRFRFTAALLGLFLFAALSSKAQPIITPTQADITLVSVSSNALFINCDMLSTTSGPLRAFSWFLSGISGSVIKVQDDVGGSATVLVSDANSPYTDIVLADDASNPGIDYIVGLIYKTAMGDIYLNTYRIAGVGSGFPLSSTLLSSTQLNTPGSIGEQPHIDMFADINNPINGLPSMHQFIVSWTESSTSGMAEKAAYGDIATPATFSTFTIASGATANEIADVAASYDLANSTNYAYLLSYQGANLNLVKLNCSSSAVTTLPLTATAQSSGGGPRIEAMGLYDSATSPNPWAAIVPVNGSSSTDMYLFNNSYPAGFVCSSSFPFQSTMDGTAIAAGVGIPFASVFCNENYSIGWELPTNDSICVARAVDYTSGAISSSFPDYYQVNTLLVPTGASHGMLAMSSCSNSGKFLLTAWINQSTGRIFYKLTGDVHHYKPTGITALQQTSLSLFPNPAMEQLTIKGLSQKMNYSILSLVGRTLVSGKVTEEQPRINIQSLSPGIYLLNLVGKDGQSSKIKFVKE